MGLFGVQAVCQNLVNLYWRKRWSVVNWLTKSGWGEVGIRFVILSIVVNNKIYVICFVF